MKHLSSILLSIGVILSVVAIILPQWNVVNYSLGECQAMCIASGADKTKCYAACDNGSGPVPVGPINSGLWETCANVSGEHTCKSYTGPYKPKDILVSQILSIVGTVALAIGAVMCMMMKPRYSKLAAGLGVACLTAVLIVYATVTNSKDNNSGGVLSASFWLELSAAVVGLLGLFVPAAKK